MSPRARRVLSLRTPPVIKAFIGIQYPLSQGPVSLNCSAVVATDLSAVYRAIFGHRDLGCPPLNLLLTWDRGPAGPHDLGRRVLPDTDICLAVQWANSNKRSRLGPTFRRDGEHASTWRCVSLTRLA